MIGNGPWRVGIGGASELVTAGLTRAVSGWADEVVILGEETRSDDSGRDVDVLVLDLSGPSSPAPAGLSALWRRRVPTLAITAGRPTDHRAAMALGCRDSARIDVSASQLQEAIVVVSASSSVPAAAMTLRELQVLHLVAQGQSNTDIGNVLVIGKNTVKTYVRQAYRKIGVASRSQATRWAILRSVASAAARDALFASTALREPTALAQRPPRHQVAIRGREAVFLPAGASRSI